MDLQSPSNTLSIVGKDYNFSKWKIYLNENEITRDVSGILIELNRGCLPLITLQCNAKLNLPTRFNAVIEIPKLMELA